MESAMEFASKPDWEAARERMEAWWNREIIDRAAIQVRSPRSGVSRADYDRITTPDEAAQDHDGLFAWFTDPDLVIPRQEQYIESTFCGGEAFPTMYPVSTSMVAILAAYLGAPYDLFPGGNTGWADPIVGDWAARPRFAFDPGNEWWLRSKRLLEAAAQRAAGRYAVGLPDLNGPAEILALLRGTEELALDLIDVEAEVIIEALEEINTAWLRYWQAGVGVIHQWAPGYVFWMGVWSDLPATDLQNDFSCLISPQMFEQFFLPSLEEQTHWVERTIYHLDGPDAIRHLDMLLSLPKLDGIQWVPGAGAAPMSHWIRLLRRIQAAGKLLMLFCEPWEVETLLTELEPEGLLLSTAAESEEEARELIRKAARWTRQRQWVVP